MNSRVSRSDAEAVQSFAQGPWVRKSIDFMSNYGLIVVFVAIMGLFSVLRPVSFLRSTNIDNVLTSYSVTAILALAEMIPLSTRRFDLSVGYALGMAQVLVVAFQVTNGLPWGIAVILVIFLNTAVGAFNGVLVTVFGIDSFIATMGTGTLMYGVANWYTGGQQVVGSDLAAAFDGLSGFVGPVPLPPIYVLIISAVLWLIMERLPVGRSLYGIGANQRAAALIGIRVDRYVAGAFVASGFLSGIAGVILGSVLESGTPSVGPEYLLPAFAGALLGATSIRPGRVNVVGTIFAILILGFAFSGVQQLGAPFFVQYFFNGGILIVAVGLSVYAEARRRAVQAGKRG